MLSSLLTHYGVVAAPVGSGTIVIAPHGHWS
jgi:hypothetical protein